MKQLLPQLDTLIRTHTDALRETEQLRRILGIRMLAYRVLETTTKTGAMPVTLQQATTLCQQMNGAIQVLNGGKYLSGNEVTGIGRMNTPTQQKQTTQTKQINPEAVRLAELLVKDEVHDFEEDFPNNDLGIKIECLTDRIVVTVGDLAKLTVHSGYPAIPVDIESDIIIVYTTITNCLRYFEGISGNKKM